MSSSGEISAAEEHSSFRLRVQPSPYKAESEEGERYSISGESSFIKSIVLRMCESSFTDPVMEKKRS